MGERLQYGAADSRRQSISAMVKLASRMWPLWYHTNVMSCPVRI